MTWKLILLEAISLLFSLLVIIINIRTPVILRGGNSLEFKVVLGYYYYNGLILDLIALWPLNLVLGALDIIEPVWIIPLLRAFRAVVLWRMMDLFGRFELFFKKYNLVIYILKAVVLLFILWHWASCLWYFVNLYVDKESDFTWIDYNNLQDESFSKQIILSYYTVMNIVSTVGSGDVFPTTDVERVFVIFLINVGDAFFAVAFGLIAGIAMQASKNKSTEIFFKKMHSIKELLSQNGGDATQKSKVEQFFAYSWHLHKSTNMVSIKNLSTQLPYRLSKEVVYYSTKHLLEPMFKGFGSENLIKDVSKVLTQTIYLPGDFIILKDDIGEEMYFIAEGVVYILAADKRTVLNILGQGCYFGEMAIFLESNKRTAYVQAETFCSVLILRKTDLDNIKVNYPAVAKDIKKEARKRAIETKEIEEANREEIWREMGDPEEELKDLERMYGTPPGQRKNRFSPTMFNNTSKRSSFEIQLTPSNRAITNTLLKIRQMKKASMPINRKSDNQLPETTQPIEHEKLFKFPQSLLRSHSEEESISKASESSHLFSSKEYLSKVKSYKEEAKADIVHQRIIEEDIENEDKISQSSSSSSIDYTYPHSAKDQTKSGIFGSEKTEKLNLAPDFSFKEKGLSKFNKRMSFVSNLNTLNLRLKPQLKRSTTATNIKKKDKNSPKLKGTISKIIKTVDLERRLHSKTDHYNQNKPQSNYKEEAKGITEYRRKGLLKQRRLSRINLGKQLALSDTSGLKLQWIVDYHDLGNDNAFL